LSNQSKEPEFIKVEDILDIKPELQLRDPFTDEEIAILIADMLREGVDQKRAIALTKSIRVYPCREPENMGKFRCFDGQHKLTICRDLGVLDLEVGKDVAIDYSIDSDLKEAEKVIMGNLTQTTLSWWAKARYSLHMRNQHRWTQQQCANQLHVDRSLVSKWWGMADRIGVTQWAKPYFEEDKVKPQNSEGKVEIDIGRSLLKRMEALQASQMHIPGPERIRYIVNQTRQQIPIQYVLGNRQVDNSYLGKERRLLNGVFKFNQDAIVGGWGRRLKLVAVDAEGKPLPDLVEESVVLKSTKVKAPAIWDREGIKTKFTEESWRKGRIHQRAMNREMSSPIQYL